MANEGFKVPEGMNRFLSTRAIHFFSESMQLTGHTHTHKQNNNSKKHHIDIL
jgi:hypothetical protein